MAGSEGHRVLKMAAHNCPFCKGAIGAELAQYGGNCPHCMLEVPGEDAPTDPGAILREKHAEEEQRRVVATARTGRMQLGLAAVAILGLASAGGYYVYSHRAAAVYELDDYYVQPLEEIAAAPTPAVVESNTKPTKKNTKGTVPVASAAAVKAPTGNEPAASPTAALRPTAGADSVASLANTMSVTAPSPGPAVTLGGMTVDVSQPAMILTDQQQIFDMAKTVINRLSPQLQACYQQRLKQVPDLAGAWKVELTITKDGRPSAVDVSGQERQDSELESCMERSIAGWHFTRIAFEQPVAKTYRFKPAT